MEKSLFRYLTNSFGQLLHGFHSENLLAHRDDLLQIFVVSRSLKFKTYLQNSHFSICP